MRVLDWMRADSELEGCRRRPALVGADVAWDPPNLSISGRRFNQETPIYALFGLFDSQLSTP